MLMLINIKINTIALPLLFFSLICYNSTAQSGMYRPLRISQPVKLDGKFDEPFWQQTEVMNDFVMADPQPGATPTEKTEFKIAYDDVNLYIAYSCFDSEANKIVHNNMERDSDPADDDGIAILIDTYHDKSSAIGFAASASGARFDVEFSQNGSNQNASFNTFWNVESEINDKGYFLEFQIPFSSLRFKTAETVLMGIKSTRIIKRKNEFSVFPSYDITVLDPYNKMSLAANMEFKNLHSKKPFYIVPYAIANFNENKTLNDNGTAYKSNTEFISRKNLVKDESLDKIISNIGIDAKYGITKNFTLDLTANTDFAQAEVDNRIINLSKYEVNLPEKRNFFLESRSFLNYSLGQGTQLFISRKIGREGDLVVPIIAGARITGKQNGLAIGALNMQTAAVDAAGIDPQNYSVMRFRKDLDKRGSFFGGIVTNRVNTKKQDETFQTYALDYVKKITEQWIWGWGLASTNQKGVRKFYDANVYYNLFAFHQTPEGHNGNLDFGIVEKNFNPAMGFNDDREYARITIGNSYRKKVKKQMQLNYCNIGNTTQYKWRINNGETETILTQITPVLEFKNGSLIEIDVIRFKRDKLFFNWQISNDITIPAKSYDMYDHTAYYQSNRSKQFLYDVFLSHGDFYGGKISTSEITLSHILNKYLRFEVNYQYNHIKFTDEFSATGKPIYQSNLINLNAIVTLSKSFSIKLLSQYDDLSEQIGGNLRLRYNPKEGTDLYIVYNQLQNTNRLTKTPELPLIDNQAVVVKFVKTFEL